MILTCDAIRREIEAGRVVIEPFFADQVGPASIDLHLGDEIRVMHDGREPVPVYDPAAYSTAQPGAPSWHKYFLTPAGAALFDVALLNDAQTAVIAMPSNADTDQNGFQVADGSAQPPPPPS